MNPEKHLLEDHIIDVLMDWLEKDRWEIISYCKGKKRGIDILAKKGKHAFIIEAKGAKGNPGHNSTKRDKFDSGQIKTHFGMAILKVLGERKNYPGSQVAIAHPDDDYIRKIITPVIPDLKKIGIRFLWVDNNDKVLEDV